MALAIGFAFNPFTFHKVGPAFHASVQWSQGENWIENSEAGWNDLIGSSGNFTTVETSETLTMIEPCQEMLLDANFGYSWFYETLTCEEREACYETSFNSIITTVPVNGVSDGIAPQFAAQMDGQCVLSNVGSGQGVNHQELVNHPGMTSIYDSIMDGDFSLTPQNNCDTDTRNYFKSL